MLTHLAELGWLPDALMRAGIRRLLRERLRQERADDPGVGRASRERVVERMRAEPIAVETDRANEQHYELPAEFYRIVLGPRLKYSACCWGHGASGLADAEDASLRITAERAGIENGMSILDLGCGWGSFALWAAEQFPGSAVLAVSNSSGQRRFVEGQARQRRMPNLEVVTADVNRFDPGRRFDRVVAIEMIEHTRNYELLLGRIASWLSPGGRLLAHVFCHRSRAYFYEPDGKNDWMARHFFSGGMMPALDLFDEFPDHLRVEARWSIGGEHYSRTLETWLERMDRSRGPVLEILRGVYGPGQARRWYGRWRLFFLACSELFAFRGGREWFVSHHRLGPAGEVRRPAMHVQK